MDNHAHGIDGTSARIAQPSKKYFLGLVGRNFPGGSAKKPPLHRYLVRLLAGLPQ